MIELLGTPLLVIVAALALGLPAATVLLWSRARGPRAARAAQRAGLLVGSQLAAVMVVAVGLNDYGNFYSSWDSLFQQPHGVAISAANKALDPQKLHRRDRAPASAGRIKHLTDPAFATPGQWPVRGRLESINLTGASSGLHEHAYVYLPPQYFQPRYAYSRFPAMEVISGYPGAEFQLLDGPGGMQYPAVMLSLVEQHRAAPTVLVMLRPTVTYPHDTECTNVPAGPQAETFYAVDLPSQIAHDYRVSATGWGAIGGSTGGYCAAKLAMLHPRVFYAAVAIQGYFTALKDSTTGDLWGGSTELRNVNNLQWRLQHMPAPPVSIMAVSSYDERDQYGYQNTKRFISLARRPMITKQIIYSHGGHNIQTWRMGLPSEMMWLSAKLPVPLASG